MTFDEMMQYDGLAGVYLTAITVNKLRMLPPHLWPMKPMTE